MADPKPQSSQPQSVSKTAVKYSTSDTRRKSLENAFDSDESSWSNSQVSDGEEELIKKKDLQEKKSFQEPPHHPIISKPFLDGTLIREKAPNKKDDPFSHSTPNSAPELETNKSLLPERTSNNVKLEEDSNLPEFPSSKKGPIDGSPVSQFIFTKREDIPEKVGKVGADNQASNDDDGDDNWDDEEETSPPKRVDDGHTDKSNKSLVGPKPTVLTIVEEDIVVDWSPSGSSISDIEGMDKDDDENDIERKVEEMGFDKKKEDLGEVDDNGAPLEEMKPIIQTGVGHHPQSPKADQRNSGVGSVGDGVGEMEKIQYERKSSINATLNLFSATVAPLKSDGLDSGDTLQTIKDTDTPSPKSSSPSKRRFLSRLLSFDTPVKSDNRQNNPKYSPSLRKSSMPVDLAAFVPDTPIKSVSSSVDSDSRSGKLGLGPSGEVPKKKRKGLIEKIKTSFGLHGTQKKKWKSAPESNLNPPSSPSTGSITVPTTVAVAFSDPCLSLEHVQIEKDEDHHDNNHQHCENLLSEINMLRSELQSNEAIGGDMTRNIEELVRENQILLSALDEERQANVDLETNMGQMKEGMATQEELISRLTSEKLDMEGNVKQLEMDGENLKNQVLDLEVERDNLQEAIEELGKKCEGMGSENSELGEKVMNLEDKLKSSLSANEEILNEMKSPTLVTKQKFQEEKNELEDQIGKLVEEHKTSSQKQSELCSTLEKELLAKAELEKKSAQEFQTERERYELLLGENSALMKSEVVGLRGLHEKEKMLREDSDQKVKAMQQQLQASLEEYQLLLQENLRNKQNIDSFKTETEKYKAMYSQEKLNSQDLERALEERRDQKLKSLEELHQQQEFIAQQKLKRLERDALDSKVKCDEEKKLREDFQNRWRKAEQHIQKITENHKHELKKEQDHCSQLVSTFNTQLEEEKARRDLLQTGQNEAQQVFEAEMKTKRLITEKLTKSENEDRKKTEELKRSKEKISELKLTLKSDKELLIKSVDKLEKYKDLAGSFKAQLNEAKRVAPETEKVLAAFTDLKSQLELQSETSQKEKESLLNEIYKLGQENWRLESARRKLEENLKILEADASTWKNLAQLKDRVELDLIELKRAIQDQYIDKAELDKLRNLYEGKVAELKSHYEKEVRLQVDEALTQLGRQTRDHHILGKIRDLHESSLRAELSTVTQSMYSDVQKLRGIISERDEQIVSLKKSLDIVNGKYAEEGRQREVLRRRLQFISSASPQNDRDIRISTQRTPTAVKVMTE